MSLSVWYCCILEVCIVRLAKMQVKGLRENWHTLICTHLSKRPTIVNDRSTNNVTGFCLWGIMNVQVLIYYMEKYLYDGMKLRLETVNLKFESTSVVLLQTSLWWMDELQAHLTLSLPRPFLWDHIQKFKNINWTPCP